MPQKVLRGSSVCKSWKQQEQLGRIRKSWPFTATQHNEAAVGSVGKATDLEDRTFEESELRSSRQYIMME